MAIALVGQAGGSSFATSRVQAYSSTGGNTLVLFIAHQTDDVTSVTDTAGNTWVKAKSNLDDSAVGEAVCSTYYVLDAAAITSVTVAVGATDRSIHTRISEWTGVGVLRDAASVYNSSFSSPTCSAPVTVAAGDLVVSGTAYFTPDATDDVTPPTGFTGWPALSISTVFSEAAYRLDPPAGTENAEWTYSPGRRNGGVTASFAEPSASTPIGRVTDSSTVRPLAVTKTATIGHVIDDGQSGTFAATKARPIGRVTTLAVIRPLALPGAGLGRVTTTGQARTLAATKTQPIGRVTSTTAVRSLTFGVPQPSVPDVLTVTPVDEPHALAAVVNSQALVAVHEPHTLTAIEE